MNFAFFKDPRSYAFLADEGVKCGFCSTSEDCLDGANLHGVEDIEAVCFKCMQAGKLIELDIYANNILEDQLSGDKESISNIITYMTPSIPAWQDLSWPVKNGVPYKFIKIASKLDYQDKDEFVASLFDCDQDPDLWDMLPDHKINNMKEGQYDLSFYLFESDGDKLTLWDAN